MDRYKGQCYCHPSLPHGECIHCNRARMWVDQDVLTLASELGESIDVDEIENLYGSDGEPQDVMQWFIVSRWLYGVLRSEGEPVAEWKGQYWWGRTCCGQAIELDGTLQGISCEMEE